jgi:uncharacterized protein (DUF433 family)
MTIEEILHDYENVERDDVACRARVRVSRGKWIEPLAALAV